jgi:uncharacterized protein with PIN domain
MLGFDTAYRNDYADEDLARISSEERRILLTRDRGLLKRSAVTHGHLMRETNPKRQLAEVVDRFDLYRSAAPLTRCLRCNTPLRETDKPSIASRLPEGIKRLQTDFLACELCGRIYWKGSHYDRMLRMIREVLGQTPAEAKPE